jgi:signal transduction histidine kinase
MDGLNATIRDIRAYILDLRPRRFSGEELVVALQRLLAEFKANTLMAVDLRADPAADGRLAPAARQALFHIAQEALSNAARHSRASRVTVELVKDGPSVRLSLRDNGRGFVPAQIAQHTGYGLANMRDRAAAAGGEMQITNAPDGGTEVTVRIPTLE